MILISMTSIQMKKEDKVSFELWFFFLKSFFLEASGEEEEDESGGTRVQCGQQ